MAKRKRKQFQKKQLITLFENKNYQKVISKIKQFDIPDISELELYYILRDSYEGLAESHFLKGDMVRAIREINTLLGINQSQEYQLLKLKYLCYMENFKEAISIAELLIKSRNNKIKKDAILFYLLAKIYNGEYELDNKLLKILTKSRQNYILGFIEFKQGRLNSALDYFHKCKPRGKIEKENLKAIISIINNEEFTSNTSTLKPLYRFIIALEEEGLQKSPNLKKIRKELKEQFHINKNYRDIKKLLILKESIPIETITNSTYNREEIDRLIFNNISILVENEKYKDALKIFIKYYKSMVNFIESAPLFMNIKNNIEDKKSDKILINFFSTYLKLHHNKLAPFYIDYIIFFLLKENVSYALLVARNYNRDNFILLAHDLPLSESKDIYLYQNRFNLLFKKYSAINNKILNTLLAKNIVSMGYNIEDLSKNLKRDILNYLLLIIKLLNNLERPHIKYKETILNIITALASTIQSVNYFEYKEIYNQLLETIEHYILDFNINRLDLSIDIKALYISIEAKKSIKKIYDMYDEDDFFEIGLRMLGLSDESQYNLDRDKIEVIYRKIVEKLRKLEKGGLFD